MAIIPSFFGRLFSEGAGVAVGTAAAKGVEPPLQNLANTMESAFANKPIDAVLAAALRARETLPDYPGIDLGEVAPKDEAAYSGIRGKRFDALTELAREHPSVGELLELRRRRLALDGDAGIGRDEFREWLRRQGLTKDVIDAITKLLVRYLDPADVANAVQQGFMPNEGILPEADLHGGPYTVASEQENIDPIKEAGVHGYDEARLKVLAQLSGNPPGPQELLEMWRRSIITEGDVERGVREGRTKTKWLPKIKELRWKLLSDSTIVNLFLRGWIGRDEYHSRMLVHGYGNAEADDWYDSAGRPMAPQQAATAFFRGAPSPLRKDPDGSPATFNKADFIEAIRRSDVRPEYGEPLWAIRYAYPPIFQIGRAVLAGVIDAETGGEWLHANRYHPDVINAFKRYWNENTTADESKYVGRADTHLFSAVQRSFIARETGITQARTVLGHLGVDRGDQDTILARWQDERDLVRRQLTPAQIKKSYLKTSRNAATGNPWTRDEAIAALVSEGYSVQTANDFLDSGTPEATP